MVKGMQFICPLMAWKYAYGGVYTIATSEKWQRLLNVYTSGEYEDDGNGNYYWKLWEWKY
jgi:hypothetical protein